ncbi:MAG TPA: gamma-glutamyl-gamma-aminobutyrate hydrolase family protein [Vicinamibacterales bacterium]
MVRIGLTPCSRLPDYETSVTRAGAGPVVLDLQCRDAAALLAQVDALILTGGGDVNPALYGETPHERFTPAEPGRDEIEIALAREVVARRVPLLAICRGMQVLNVSAGGSLEQDIPSGVPAALNHQVDTTPSTIAHDVWVTSGSLLARLMAESLEDDTLRVNSRHHQAVKRVAPGFVVTATAPDGVIEAIEHPELPFCLGVQWHPENFWRTGEFRPLFEGLAAAAAEYRVRR